MLLTRLPPLGQPAHCFPGRLGPLPGGRGRDPRAIGVEASRRHPLLCLSVHAGGVPARLPPALYKAGQARIGGEHGGSVMPMQYRAPEVILDMKWGHPVHDWSVGLSAWNPPSALAGNEKTQFVDFSQSLLCWLPGDRLTVGKAYYHPWLRLNS
ncbi:hypothetical protein QBC33DRAFT_341677 [Phialemonium atrogriseum]|uniref:Protein kinase domain-containing protein n=1 Tax=Phialemonium atrogriseum TaxID=1093897 RepID=A0AAJ0FNK5_9PEZI|nr:uncharacterized protein QBC33DRAFT_341677 [Phialemonium atrogriseum]KAK1769094.1 hypothetical protein QBC33DRAFT_341677 [Phialemonium atrogriseum]